MKADEAETETGAGRGTKKKKKEKKKKKGGRKKELVQNFKSALGLTSSSLIASTSASRPPPPPPHSRFCTPRVWPEWSIPLPSRVPPAPLAPAAAPLPRPPLPPYQGAKNHPRPLGHLLMRLKLEHLPNQQEGAPRDTLDLHSPLQTSLQKPDSGEPTDRLTFLVDTGATSSASEPIQGCWFHFKKTWFGSYQCHRKYR